MTPKYVEKQNNERVYRLDLRLFKPMAFCSSTSQAAGEFNPTSQKQKWM